MLAVLYDFVFPLLETLRWLDGGRVLVEPISRSFQGLLCPEFASSRVVSA